MSEPRQRHASCSCGQLRADVTGEPIRVSMCHCYACQHRSGSAFSYQARFRAEQVTTSGTAHEYVRHSDEDGAQRSFFFCPECGATVWYMSGDSPELIAIPVGGFADREFPEPQFSVWEERRHAWVTVPAGAERIA
jgi:hypothetical protein